MLEYEIKIERKKSGAIKSITATNDDETVKLSQKQLDLISESFDLDTFSNDQYLVSIVAKAITLREENNRKISNDTPKYHLGNLSTFINQFAKQLKSALSYVSIEEISQYFSAAKLKI